MSYTWSYSSINLFKQCPKKYHHIKILKDVIEPRSEALVFGNKVHEAAEFYVKENTPLPKELLYLEGVLSKLKEFKGDRLCDYRMGLTNNLQPCGFFDKNVWGRGIADLIILGDDKAYLVDYKTGKNSKYADTKQLEILSLAMFKHFPKIKKIKAGLLFIITKELIKKSFNFDEQDTRWSYWFTNTKDLEKTIGSNVWNAKPNFTCKRYCAVLSCSHNGQGE